METRMTTHDNVRRLVLASAWLLAAVVASCGGADACVQSQCTSGAALEIPLAAVPASGTTVKACRNGECYTAALPELPTAEEATAGLSFTGAPLVVGILWQDAAGSVELDLEWHLASSDEAVDGDHYVVTLTEPSGTETTVLDQVATYLLVPPSPEQCSPAPSCRIAHLRP
jgi:hypothetical protein